MADDFNQLIVDEFRATDGRMSGTREGNPTLLLTTTGARSGRPRLVPLMYLADETEPGRLLLFASNSGSLTHPDWYHNLIAHPVATVEVGTDRYEARAAPLAGAERDAAYAEMVRRYSGFGDYEIKAGDRVIPVIALTRL